MCFVVAAAPLLAAAAQPGDRATAFSIWSSYMPTGGTHRAARGAVGGQRMGLARSVDRCLRLCRGGGRYRACALFPPSKYGQGSSMRLVAESLMSRGNIAMACCFAFYVAQVDFDHGVAADLPGRRAWPIRRRRGACHRRLRADQRVRQPDRRLAARARRAARHVDHGRRGDRRAVRVGMWSTAAARGALRLVLAFSSRPA